MYDEEEHEEEEKMCCTQCMTLQVNKTLHIILCKDHVCDRIY